MDALKTLFYSGTSGLVLNLNKTQFPEDFKEKTRLHYYASLFNSIEINSSFYKLPKSATVLQWADSVPDHFRFTFKIPKALTHAHDLAFSETDLNNFMEVIAHAGAKKGCLLAQFPPSFHKKKLPELQTFLEAFKLHNSDRLWPLALEFRNASWYVPEVNELCKLFDVQMVLHDFTGAAIPVPWPKAEGNFVYIRFHGPDQRYGGNYSDAYLKSAANYINDCIRDKKTVYVYFNNTLGAAFYNLQTVNTFVHANPLEVI